MSQPPTRYADIIGQDESIARLGAFAGVYSKNGDAADHILLVAEDGMGKRTIANVLANELGTAFQAFNASDLQVKGDFTATLTNLRDRQVLLIRDVHKLKPAIGDLLLQALRTYKMTITVGEGRSARNHVMDIKPFTLVGTARKKSMCSEELLSCFSLVLTLQPYKTEALELIVRRIAALANLEIDLDAAGLIATNSGSPHQVEVLTQRVARAVRKQLITAADALEAFAAFGMRVHTDVHAVDFPNLQLMSGIEFERLVTALLTRMEFRAEMTKATGDGGIDIIAILDKPILGGKYLFQCKRYAPDNLVGASIVRDFYGAVTADKAVKGILITTSDFTAQAREFAE